MVAAQPRSRASHGSDSMLVQMSKFTTGYRIAISHSLCRPPGKLRDRNFSISAGPTARTAGIRRVMPSGSDSTETSPRPRDAATNSGCGQATER
jgi:hypothetical protein